MSSITIAGSVEPATGEVTLSGAKNAALKVLAASVLAEEDVVLDNMPLNIRDVRIKLQMLRAMGARIEERGALGVRISWPASGPSSEIPGRFGSVRTSLLLLGALLGRTGRGSVPLPGGCRIGPRKHDMHIMALESLGAVCRERGDRLEARAKSLTGGRIVFPFRTTGGTENAILAAVRARGRTLLCNAHTRPEVMDLIRFLNCLGARISVLGSGLIEIEGVDRLGGGRYSIIYDNVEAMTFAVFAAITKGRISIRHFPAEDLEVPMIYLRESGVRFRREGDCLVVERPGLLTPFDLSTGTYPGVNSDIQPLFAALASQAEGETRITDIRFRDRFQYVAELGKLGARISVRGNTVIVSGPCALRGAEVNATDLRGGAALVAAALVAEGPTTIRSAEQIDRGYEDLAGKLAAVGVRVNRRHRAAA